MHILIGFFLSTAFQRPIKIQVRVTQCSFVFSLFFSFYLSLSLVGLKQLLTLNAAIYALHHMWTSVPLRAHDNDGLHLSELTFI